MIDSVRLCKDFKNDVTRLKLNLMVEAKDSKNGLKFLDSLKDSSFLFYREKKEMLKNYFLFLEDSSNILLLKVSRDKLIKRLVYYCDSRNKIILEEIIHDILFINSLYMKRDMFKNSINELSKKCLKLESFTNELGNDIYSEKYEIIYD